MNLNIFMTIASLDPSTGGPARSVPSLGEAIHKAGVDVQLYVNNKTGESDQSKKTTSTFLSVKAINDLDNMVKGLNRGGKDNTVIHNHGIWLPLNHYASVTARRYNIPLIISPMGMLEPWARSYHSWKKMIAWCFYQRRDLKAATVLQATSKQEAGNLQLLDFHIPIAIIPNGVDIPEFPEPVVKDKTNLKTALFLSRVHPVKGLLNLVRAWAKIRPVNWRVVIAGPDEGGHQIEIEQEIQRHELSDSFSFIGSVADQDKWELYRSADLFVLPTHSENFGIVIAEALASGTPVITTKGTPWKELVENKCGWWIDIGVEPLAEALTKAMNLSPEERQVMGQRGRRLVEQNYSWDKIGNEMLSVYEWILGKGPKPECVITD